MTCSNCGSPLDQEAAFCGNCGRAIVATAGEAASTPPPPSVPPSPPAIPASPPPVTPTPAPGANVAYAVPGSPVPPPTKGSNGKATASMVLGIISLITWLLPLVGIPVTVLALVFGIRNRQSGRSGQAIAGIVMGCISIPLIILSMIIGIIAATKH